MANPADRLFREIMEAYADRRTKGDMAVTIRVTPAEFKALGKANPPVIWPVVEGGGHFVPLGLPLVVDEDISAWKFDLADGTELPPVDDEAVPGVPGQMFVGEGGGDPATNKGPHQLNYARGEGPGVLWVALVVAFAVLAILLLLGGN